VRAQPCVLVKYGELALKGRNRPAFEQALLRNLETKLSEVPGAVRIRRRPGVIVLYPEAVTSELVERVREVMGISVVQRGVSVPKTPQGAAYGVETALRQRFGDAGSDPDRTFAIRARRRNKRFPMDSMQLAAYVGQQVREQRGWSVRLDDPEVAVELEVDTSEVFVCVARHRGEGGLPVGTSGQVVALLSGGFDSPVAAYRAMRRGLRCELVHFTGAPYTGPSSAYKAYALARQLSRFQGETTLRVVPIGRLQRALATAGAGALQSVSHRRLMLQIAATVAGEVGADGLVTGDSLGQVSSQTLSNLASTEQASPLPLLRPLLAWDKEEIVDEARRIGTAEISRLADEDCCTLLAPPVAATRSEPEQLARIESRVGDLGELVQAALAQTQTMTITPHEQDPVAVPA
jgi:tRNA uracil 4-sulfurtransferase